MLRAWTFLRGAGWGLGGQGLMSTAWSKDDCSAKWRCFINETGTIGDMIGWTGICCNQWTNNQPKLQDSLFVKWSSLCLSSSALHRCASTERPKALRTQPWRRRLAVLSDSATNNYFVPVPSSPQVCWSLLFDLRIQRLLFYWFLA